LPHVALRAQLFVKVGARPRACGDGPLSGARPLGDDVGSRGSDPLDPTSSPQFGPGCPRSQLFVKMGAGAPVPHGVGATVSDILMVNPVGVIDVFNLYTRLTNRLDPLLIKPLSG